MGTSQSKLPEPLMQQRLSERLQALGVKDSSEKDYIYVDNEQKAPLGQYSPTVSINRAEQWEKELLADPKVLYD